MAAGFYADVPDLRLDVDADIRVKSSRGWYDADDYARQAAGA